jgi:predicted Mrr-cat superfamily restriction endonuclease
VLRLRGGMYHETSGKNGNYRELTDNMFFINMAQNDMFKDECEDVDEDDNDKEDNDVDK